ncbi:MAG: hypothetical protein WBC74_01845 [Candidatus Omnitrophota bacterium]
MIDFSIRVAGKLIRFKSEGPLLSYNPRSEREFAPFLRQGPKRADITFDIKYGSIPDFSGKEVLFDVDKSWSLSRYGEKILFEYPDRSLQGRVERTAEINKDMTEGVIYINREKTKEEEEESRRQRELQRTEEDKKRQEERKKRAEERRALRAAQGTPNDSVATLTKEAPKMRKPKKKTPEELGRKVMSEVKANFFQAFLVEYLVRQKTGFLAHCASVQSDKKLYLFMGQSHTGKSTIADFWHMKAGATVFNDDRAIIAVKNGSPRFHNAPWVGTLVDKCDLGNGDGTEVNGIFFLNQQDKNTLRRIGKAEAAAKIFRNSFPVFWEKSALSYVLGLCSAISRSVPCYDLGFVNNDSVVTFLKKELKKPA